MPSRRPHILVKGGVEEEDGHPAKTTAAAAPTSDPSQTFLPLLLAGFCVERRLLEELLYP